MRVAIVGAGGLGGLIGGYLARAGLDVTFITRGANLHALRTRGLTIQPVAEAPFHVGVHATEDARDVGSVDVVWVCVKTYDLAAVGAQVKPLIGDATLVLPVQNGVEAAHQLTAILGAPHVLGCVAVAGGTLVEPGLVAQKLPTMRFKVGELQGASVTRIAHVQWACRDALALEASADIERELWEKLMVASVSLGLTAVSRLPLGPLFATPSTAILARRLMDEVGAVGRARGVNCVADVVERQYAWLAAVATTSPSARGSMYFDLIGGKRLELDAVTGAVVRLGCQAEVATPYNFAVYATLEPHAAGGAVAVVTQTGVAG